MTDRFRRRILIAEGVILLWGLTAGLFHFHWAFTAREAVLREGGKIARHSGVLYPVRGRILDDTGRVLAWTECYFDLCRLPNRPCPPAIARMVEDICPGATTRWVIYGISPRQVNELAVPLRQTATWELSERRVRRTAAPERTGMTEFRDGRLVGISGAELAFENRLAGRPGEYEVMRGPYRVWIEKTFQMTQEIVPAEDIVLPPETAPEGGKQ